MNKITLKTVHQEVANSIREMIQKGELQRGEKIKEIALCELFGISRTPIREALRILHTQGIVDLIPHRGAFVSQFDVDYISDMFEVMSGLEGMCARIATQKMTPPDLQKIENLHLVLEKHFKNNNPQAYLKHNWEFHEFIRHLSKNKVLNEVINGLRQKILLYRQRQLYQPNRFKASMQEHRDILAAFKQKDPEKAEEAMKRHLLNQGRSLVKSYTKEGIN
jgi:DNA-binding GntR family transcriptional regulator